VQINLKVINAMTDAFMRKHWLARAERQQLREYKRTIKNSRHCGNGERECARRRRQIAAGQLTRSNGLDATNRLRSY
jgi:hypothetical protein